MNDERKHDTLKHAAAGGFGLRAPGCARCELDEYVERVVAQAPPLSPEQVALVARLLAPYSRGEPPGS